MKKYLVLLSFLCLLLFSPSVQAKDLWLSDYQIEATIKENGDLAISEEMTSEADGHYNGLYYNLDKKEVGNKTTSVRDIAAYEKVEGQTKPLSQNDSETEGSYQLKDQGGKLEFKLFLPLDADKKRTIILAYTLKSSIVNYLDAAELNRKLIGSGWEIKQENIRIHISLPQALNQEKLRAWVHASQQGQVNIDPDYKGVTITMPQNQAGDFVEAHVLFPPEVTQQNPNQVKEKAWERILDQEAQLAQEQLRHQEDIKREKATAERFTLIIMPVLATSLAGVYLFIQRPFRAWEKKVPLVPDHVFDIPRDLSPAVMDFHIFKHCDGRDMGATLLDLVRKKKLQLDRLGQSYYFTLLSREGLLSHEKVLIHLLFDKISPDQPSLNLDQIKRYAKKHPTAYGNEFENFKKTIIQQKPFYKDKETRFFSPFTWISTLLVILAGLVGLWACVINPDLINHFIAIFVLSLLILLSNRLFSPRRTLEEEHQYRQWKAFERMLRDFRHLDRADIESIVIWDHILVYAASLGVAKDVVKHLHRVFPEGIPATVLSPDFSHHLYSPIFYQHFNNSMRQAYQSSVSNNANGTGGSFSGGSSGGFGGGSGGGGF